MPILLVAPATLLKVPALRLTVEAVVKPERSRVLCVPPFQIVTTGWVFTVKSKYALTGPVMLVWKP